MLDTSPYPTHPQQETFAQAVAQMFKYNPYAALLYGMSLALTEPQLSRKELDDYSTRARTERRWRARYRKLLLDSIEDMQRGETPSTTEDATTESR